MYNLLIITRASAARGRVTNPELIRKANEAFEAYLRLMGRKKFVEASKEIEALGEDSLEREEKETLSRESLHQPW